MKNSEKRHKKATQTSKTGVATLHLESESIAYGSQTCRTSTTTSASCRADLSLIPPEKSGSETSLARSQPQSWSDVTPIEDITQEASSKPLPALGLDKVFESSESLGEKPSPTKPPSERSTTIPDLQLNSTALPMAPLNRITSCLCHGWPAPKLPLEDRHHRGQ